MISKFLQLLGLQPRISKDFQSLEQFFLTVGQNDFGNKIPFIKGLQGMVFTNLHRHYSNDQMLKRLREQMRVIPAFTEKMVLGLWKLSS